MERLFGIKFWLLPMFAWIAGAVTLAKPVVDRLNLALASLPAYQSLSDVLPAEYVAALNTAWIMVLGSIPLLLLLHKKVFIFFSRFPPTRHFIRTRIFPDLNGEWDVELTSNWPRIKAMQMAAASHDGPRYDANMFENVPLMEGMKFKATIDQTWFGVSVEMWSQDPNSVIKRSKSRSFDLIRRPDGAAEVAYFYDQANQVASSTGTDQNNFTGSAYLSVAQDGRSMDGVYMTMRSWEKGLNTAGSITFRRPQ